MRKLSKPLPTPFNPMLDTIQLGQSWAILSEPEFAQFRGFLASEAGIDLGPHKRALVQSRLAPRLRSLRCGNFTEYWNALQGVNAQAEREQAINLLSTNETYFFREPQHFEWLQERAAEINHLRNASVRVWSAACSTGEEAYTIAITLAEELGIQAPWHVYATDINTRVTRFAQRAVYPLARAQKTPLHLWKKYFQQGQEEYEGNIRVKPELVRRVEFGNLNLLHCASSRARDFDVIILRNVLIYFNDETKQRVVEQLCSKLADGGHLLIGHAEVIQQHRLPLVQEAPSRYRYEPSRLGGRSAA
jgi:chemotaxis protein methyltransferase CheR